MLRGLNTAYVYLRFLRWAAFEERPQLDVVATYMADKGPQPKSRRPHPLRSRFIGVHPHGVAAVTVVVGAGGEDGTSTSTSTSSSSSSSAAPVQQWAAEVMVDYAREVVGVFPSEEDAARAYDRRATELNAAGAARPLNFVDPSGDADEGNVTPEARALYRQVRDLSPPSL